MGVEWGGSEFCLGVQSYSFGNSHAKIQKPPKKILELTPKCIIVGVEGGASEICLGVQSYSFGNSEPHTKIKNPRSTPSGRKVVGGEEGVSDIF